MSKKPFTYDQDKVKQLRMAYIEACLQVMAEDPVVETWSEYKKNLVMKTAPRILPVLNAGKDDDTDLIPQPLLGGKSNGDTSHESNTEAPEAQEED